MKMYLIMFYLLLSMIVFSLFPLSLFFLPELSIFIFLTLILMFFSLNFSEVGVGTHLDEFSKLMIILLLMVSSVVYLSSSRKKSVMLFLLGSMNVIIMIFFSTSSLVTFFITFEASLIPLVFIILVYGYQAERLMASQFLFMYTIIASSPLFWLMISSLSLGESDFSLSFTGDKKNEILSLFIIAFLVKIPSFIFHSWLPKAHVEAPLEGSMLLAGVMLKVGMFGLIRIMLYSPIPQWILNMVYSISLVGAVLSSFISLSSDDMKMSVAFSSISHMNIVLASLCSMKELGLFSCVIVMITHGLCSPFLFFFVTILYSISGSRSSLISKGLASKFPFLWLMGSVLWISNMSIPPFFSFSGEMMCFSSLMKFFLDMTQILLIMIFMFVGSFFSMLNMGIQSHSMNKLNQKTNHIDFLFPLAGGMMVLVVLLMFIYPPYLG